MENSTQEMNQNPDQNNNKRLANIVILAGIILIGINLRVSITAVGPLISSISDDLGLSYSAAGLLTTIPLITFALFSSLAPRIGQYLGNEKAIFISLIILTFGIIARSIGNVSMLFIGTAFIGLGIAICNVLLPSIVKHTFPLHVGSLTGLFTTAMVGGSVISSGVSVPLAYDMDLGWQYSLMFWGLISVVALFLWLPQLKGKVTSPIRVVQQQGLLWRSTIAWQVTLFMGCQSLIFYCLLTWIPTIFQEQGMSVSAAGWMLSLLLIVGLPATFYAPVMAQRLDNQKSLVLVIGGMYLLGLTGLMYTGSMFIAVFSVVIIGLVQGASLSLSFALIGLRTEHAKQTAELSGMAQSVGYTLAAIGPISIGFLYDVTQSWLMPMLLLIFFNCVMTVVGVGAGRNKYVLESQNES